MDKRKKTIPIPSPEVIVVVAGNYRISEKDFPPGLPKSVEWLCSFEISGADDDEIQEGRIREPYLIQVYPDKPGKKLVYWDGHEAIEFDDQQYLNEKRKIYRTVVLDLIDPPVGWSID